MLFPLLLLLMLLLPLMLALLLVLLLILLVLLPIEERLVSGNMACTFSSLRSRPPHEFLCICALSTVFFVLGESAQCMFVCMCLGLALPCRVAAARANPFAGILVIFLLLCSFVVVFRCRFINLVTSLFTHYTG